MMHVPSFAFDVLFLNPLKTAKRHFQRIALSATFPQSIRVTYIKALKDLCKHTDSTSRLHLRHPLLR